MKDLSDGLKHTLRSLKARPGGAATVVAALALAVGATTAVFSVVHGVLLSPLPYPEPERLVQIWQTKEAWKGSQSASRRAAAERMAPGAPVVRDWQVSETGFESIGAYVEAQMVEQRSSGAEIIQGQEATAGFFEALGVSPMLGRALQPEDDSFGALRVALVSAGFWRERYEGSQDVLGASLLLDGLPHTVVGVMPDNFAPPTWSISAALPRVWIPLTEEAYVGDKSVRTIGRLRPNTTLESASAQLGSTQDRIAVAQPESQQGRGIRTERLLDAVVGQVRSTLWFLFGAVALVLLISAANIANVLAVQGLGRGRDLAVRAALGAGRFRLVRGLLAESTLLTVVGGALGLVIARVSLPFLVEQLPPSIPRSAQIGITPGVLVVALVVTGATALLVGSLPAFVAARTNPQDTLRGGSRGVTTGTAGRRARSVLVVAEVALAFVLLVSAALLANSYARLWSVERGFDSEGLVAMTVVPAASERGTPELEDRFIASLGERLNALPGVSASVANNVPLSGDSSGVRVVIEPVGGSQEQEISALLSVSTPGYLEVMGVPVLSGRPLALSDTAQTQRVALVNQSFAKRFWAPGQELGNLLRADGVSVEVVGVVADVRHKGLALDVSPKVYLPASQSNRFVHEWILRVEGPFGPAVQRAQEEVASLSPATPVSRVMVVEESISRSVAVPRFRTVFVVGLALLAVGLALLGLYGILAFAVAQQRQEIGVRMALGASSRQVTLRVVGAGLRLTSAGVVIGTAVSWLLSRGLQQFLFDVAPHDALTYALMIVTVLSISSLASLLPARRAARVNPIEVLRD